jgi:TonB family protein
VNSSHAPSYARGRAQAFTTAPPIEGPSEEAEFLSTKKSADRQIPIDGQLRVRLASISLLSLVVISSYILGAAAGRRGWSEFLGIAGTHTGPGRRVTIEQENRTVSAPPPQVITSAPIRRAENSPVRVPQITPGATSKIPIVPTQPRITVPRGSTLAPAPREHDVTVPSRPIPERMNEIPGPATEAARIPAPAVTPPESPRTELATTSMPAVKVSENSASPTPSIEIIPDLYPTIRGPSESKAHAPRQGISLAIGHLISKVEPVYPQEALRQRIAGTVKLHVLIARNGTVEKAELTDGPALLAEAALRAVQQWHYEPTFLGGEATQAEEDITIVFRLTNPAAPAN